MIEKKQEIVLCQTENLVTNLAIVGTDTYFVRKDKSKVTTRNLDRSIKNYKNGYHLNSSYWQNYKKTLPLLPQHCFDIAIGMILGDASIYKVSNQAYIKFEQGYKQQAFLENLFDNLKTYCFMDKPGKRFNG